MRQSAAWGLYLVVGTTAQSMSIALSLLLGGSMVLKGSITPEQLTSFMFYVQLVTTSSLAVCDQYGAIMEVGTGHRQPRRGMRLSTDRSSTVWAHLLRCVPTRSWSPRCLLIGVVC